MLPKDEQIIPEGRFRLLPMLRRGLGKVADIVYPPVCAGCGISTGGHAAFCADCWAGIRFIERPYCEVLGLPFTQDPGPDMLSAEAIANPPPYDRLRSVAIHDGIVRHLVHGLKYGDRTDHAVMMAGWMLRASDGAVADCDAILPVPLHRVRFIQRKFNQAAELGRHLARLSDRPFLSGALIRVKRTSQQVGLGARAREDNVKGAFAVARGREADIFGKRIVLVDDVFTTGATVASAAKVLRKAGASDITVLTFARAISGPI